MRLSPRHYSVLIISTAVLLIGACGKKTAAVDTRTYLAPALAALAGTYAHHCGPIDGPPDPAYDEKGPFVITADGKVTGPGMAYDLTRNPRIMMMRMQEHGISPTVQVHVQSEELGVALWESESEASGGVNKGGKSVKCLHTQPPRFYTKSLYAYYSGLMDGSANVKCTSKAGADMGVTAYELKNGLLKVANEVIDLNRIDVEVIVINERDNFGYSGTNAEQSRYGIVLDKQGELSSFSAERRDGQAYKCNRQR